ncbi:hypothetical protein [Pyxidicoccus sp. MSG2]|uniref:hypothetical protein n=1 Tax=Pyxidicoccus sp. MSG2 TaxID=2996790 RepID=UPI002270F2F8|nr:hypothetical protein [Pyxidicoccus sp. MSG2]MCY1021474.1 hypothetical protein [Pyxidicoccus sp. MSG2]
MKNAVRLLALLALTACGPASSPESPSDTNPAQDAAALRSEPGNEAGPPGCDTVRITCPSGGSIGCKRSNTLCIPGRTSCSVVCDNVETYCPGTSQTFCPL